MAVEASNSPTKLVKDKKRKHAQDALEPLSSKISKKLVCNFWVSKSFVYLLSASSIHIMELSETSHAPDWRRECICRIEITSLRDSEFDEPRVLGPKNSLWILVHSSFIRTAEFRYRPHPFPVSQRISRFACTGPFLTPFSSYCFSIRNIEINSFSFFNSTTYQSIRLLVSLEWQWLSRVGTERKC